MTGFDTSEIGEIGLRAFHLQQFPYPLAKMLNANSLIASTLLAPETLPKLLEAIAQGVHMGKTPFCPKAGRRVGKATEPAAGQTQHSAAAS